MKLLRADFQNFRLLRDLSLVFSSEPNKKLTVIRAANESGKTTILHGLQWALYGDSALPGNGKGFRLYPIDWNKDEGTHVPITVTIEFMLTTHRRVGDEVREYRRQYRLVRSAFEEVDGQKHRMTSTVKLFLLNNTGASPIETPESLIKDELPPELREVFFTDGDRALSFIEADVPKNTKRKRVQGAIRSLLGLGVLDDAIKHVRISERGINSKAKQLGGNSDLNIIASNLEDLENNHELLENNLIEAKEQFVNFDINVREIDVKIAAVLQKGDKEILRKDIDNTKMEIKRLDALLSSVSKEHSTLFRSRSIAIDLLAPVVAGAFEKLELLRDQGKFPSATIPVLRERLKEENCICGETLTKGDPNGDLRRKHIHQLIEDSERADEIQKIITDLYFGTRYFKANGQSDSTEWPGEYKDIVKKYDDLQTLRDRVGRKYRALEQQLDSILDKDIQGLREQRRWYMEHRDLNLARQTSLETQLANLQQEIAKLKVKRDKLLREQKKGARILAEMEVTQDVMTVLRNAFERITNEELHKVSELMNSIFLEMIGADPEQGAIIRRTEINENFDIIVYGPNERKLNPDRDLNGASRRALTLAFILALTKVSEVEAPNVIDTPLGMTSGFVKRSILRTAVRESSQLILFLTHDEIAGCEEIIDEATGSIFTLTNPAHFPKMLVNDPGIIERKILRCNCDHRNECQLCNRRVDEHVELYVTS